MINYELELLGLGDEKIDSTLLQCESHTHREGKICIAVILAELRRVGPLEMPFPVAIIHASQSWDDGGSRLNPQTGP